MLSHAVLRLLDSYFRHRWLYLIPLVVFTALGGLWVANQERLYRTDGVLLVDDATLLSSLTGVGGADGGWQTPAAYTSRQLNALLQTDAFVDAIVVESGLADPAALTADARQRLRGSVGSWEQGENLVQVWAVYDDAQVAQKLAEATIASFIQWQIDAEVNESTAADSFLTPLTTTYREQLQEARTALEDYLRQNPAPQEGPRPASQQLVIDGLTAEVSDANARYTQAVANQESARLANAQAESDVRSRLQVVDAPTTPVLPGRSLKSTVVNLGAFVAIGALLTVAAVGAGALSDQSLRFPSEVRRQLDLDVVAVLPDASAWALAPEPGDR